MSDPKKPGNVRFAATLVQFIPPGSLDARDCHSTSWAKSPTFIAPERTALLSGRLSGEGMGGFPFLCDWEDQIITSDDIVLGRVRIPANADGIASRMDYTISVNPETGAWFSLDEALGLDGRWGTKAGRNPKKEVVLFAQKTPYSPGNPPASEYDREHKKFPLASDFMDWLSKHYPAEKQGAAETRARTIVRCYGDDHKLVLAVTRSGNLVRVAEGMHVLPPSLLTPFRKAPAMVLPGSLPPALAAE